MVVLYHDPPCKDVHDSSRLNASLVYAFNPDVLKSKEDISNECKKETIHR